MQEAMRKITEHEMRQLENRIPDIARRAGKQAFQDTLDSGHSVLVAEDGWIIRVFPDGRRVQVSQILKQNLGSEVSVFLTKDPHLLNQYYSLRRSIYREENGFTNYSDLENNFDRDGKIIVSVSGGEVVGGMRLMLSDECSYLSNERAGTQYEYRKFIQNDDRKNHLTIAEVSAFVVEKTYRNFCVMEAMFDFVFKEAVAHGCEYVVAVTSPLTCRGLRMIFRRFGYQAEIDLTHPWFQQEIYNHRKMFPVYAKLRKI